MNDNTQITGTYHRFSKIEWIPYNPKVSSPILLRYGTPDFLSLLFPMNGNSRVTGGKGKNKGFSVTSIALWMTDFFAGLKLKQIFENLNFIVSIVRMAPGFWPYALLKFLL